MATRSNIGIELSNGEVEFIYCHWDGYIENNGKILYNHYNDLSKIEELIDLGAISSLEPDIEDIVDYASKGEPHKVWVGKTRNDAFENEYCYIWVAEEERWIVKWGGGPWVSLEEALKNL